ncbi:MAG: ribonuclease HII [Lachnospiraceae bacterium]|nr:ribonuclease HII [Lachnospiraceae bacterium]
MAGISELRQRAKELDISEIDAFILENKDDDRAGVVKILEDCKKRKDKYLAELARIDNMLIYENKYFDFANICGIDEVGRGPLAGPVVAGAVILPKGCKILYVNDSKKLTAKQREELSEEIMDKAVSYGIGIVGHERIDEINILQATYEAMRAAVVKLDPAPDLLLNDAVIIPELKQKQVKIIKGDAKSLSIASASIIAKVTRDRYMEFISDKYPEYDFASNKGYGSAAHIEALKKYGPCEIHRRSFIGNFV